MPNTPDMMETAIIPQPPTGDIKDLILMVRGMQVLLDSDVARLYGYETRRVNEAAKRNINRFPEHFRFQLTHDEIEDIMQSQFATASSKSQFATLNGIDSLRSQIATLNTGRGSNIKKLPYAYTEQGIGMLSGLLKNETAIQVSIGIMDAFVEMRSFLSANRDVFAKTNRDFHDRFVIVDGRDAYAFGASLKDLGKRCFGVFKVEDTDDFLARVKRIVV
ncbi:MAG: ORF6N domain-containing protein [Coriobacteriales bacterium]|nr:ORF6N domain-containing protein [Coriobacteriales bacterium]